MRRFFIETTPNTGEELTLRGDEARHMLTVLRMKQGDELLLISGGGSEYPARIEGCSRDEVRLSVLSERACTAESDIRVTLFQCLPKSAKLETIVQKCVELGIYAVQPVYSKRCVVRPDGGDNKLVRCNRVSREAAKQCGRGIAPQVREAVSLHDCDFSRYDLVIVAYENERELTLKTLLRDKLEGRPGSIALLIGPEGGLEQSEVRLVLDSNENAYSVTLGRRILRTETAGMAMLAMLMYELED